MKRILILMLLITADLQAQTDFELIEQEVLATYRVLKKAHLEQHPERQRIFSAKLKNQLMFALLQDGSYYYPFLRLREYVHVVESPDKRIRVFSWDVLDLGHARNVCSLVQYRGVKNESYFHILSAGTRSSDKDRNVFIRGIHVLKAPSGRPYYLLIGNGSYAKGQEHTTVRIFYFGHNQLLECLDCFEGNLPYWSMQGSTQFPVELQYDFRREKLYYYQPTYHPQTGQRVKGLHYQLYWKDGFFRGY
ncbi:MAG: Unknown protein [uncultured Aureispira sp.]|uniref:Uncharacterized protein n=1 Tax=uncultured Aureispira sp. TaxID=1331704 RepID=A0A6S6U1L9_9BACT|nr:MAG: Unknown protein [uncultured Aureispira sp.]